MAEIFPEKPITSLPDAVAFLGALPMKVGPVPQALPVERLAEIEARASEATVGPWCADAWEIYQGAEYEPGISPWIGETCRGTSSPEQDRADAVFVAAARSDVPALVAEVRRLRGALSEACGQVAGLESELGGASASLSDTAVRMRADAARIAELEGANSAAVAVSETLYRTLTDEKLAGSALYAALTQPTTSEQRQAALDQFLAVARRSGQMHGPSVPDAVTQAFAPVAALREVLDGEHYVHVHHAYLKGHDLDETGGPR